MEIFREEVLRSTYFYGREERACDRLDSVLLVGRQGFDEYRSVLEVDTRRIRECCIDEENVLRVELNLFLGEVSFDEYVEEYGIDICRNLEVLDLDEVNFLNYPRFKQSYAMYNLKRDFVSKFVKFDITHLKKSLFSEDRLGITILGLGAGGIVKFFKSGKRIPYLSFECNRLNPVGEIGKVREAQKKGYGFFVSDEFKTFSVKNYKVIKWSKAIIEEGMAISENRYEIEVFNEGIYSVDYFLNIRSESEGYMFLKVDSMELEYSFVRTTFDEHGYMGKVIVRCTKGSKISLCILGKCILIQEFGGIGNIRVIKIN